MCEDRGDFEAPADEADDDKEPMDVKLQVSIYSQASSQIVKA
jgi:hypothetical protein